jgi:tRNA(Ile)-lysidine synthase
MSQTFLTNGKLIEAVKRWKLFGAADRLLIGVSGGVDSISLLRLLLTFPKPLRPKIAVAHFHHRLRKESDREARFVKKLCREWNVPFYFGKAPAWKKGKSNLEARARELRYDFFKKTAGRLKIKKILTAHHADDQAETFLIRWLQGAGLKGLGGIPLSRKEGKFSIIRPLLFHSRKEIEAYARFHRLPFHEDSTNQEPVFLRNRIRKLLKNLQKENPRLGEKTALNAVFLQADQAFLESTVEDLLKKKISLDFFRKLPDSLRFRLLQRLAQKSFPAGCFLPVETVLKLDSLVSEKGDKRYDLPGGIGFIKDKNRFKFFRKGR